MNEEMNQEKCCKNCKFYEERSGFCRLNPPTPIQQYVQHVGNVTTSVWPKIPMPLIDYCSEFQLNTTTQFI